MDDDRKYRQNGYQDRGFDRGGDRGFERERPKPQGPRPSIDITGPRLPRMVQTVTASRCYNCSTTLAPDIDFSGNCPKCNAALHCCKQCTNFEPSTRFQCRKPIPERIAYKDRANLCQLFSPQVTVARDAARESASNGMRAPILPNGPAPKSASDARAAFDNLFKK
jgi:hypothetical protein